MPIFIHALLLIAGFMLAIAFYIDAGEKESTQSIWRGNFISFIMALLALWIYIAIDQPEFDLGYDYVKEYNSTQFAMDPNNHEFVNVNKECGVVAPAGSIVRVYNLQTPYRGIYWCNAERHKYELITPSSKKYQEAKKALDSNKE